MYNTTKTRIDKIILKTASIFLLCPIYVAIACNLYLKLQLR
jgi:hypothetical protein